MILPNDIIIRKASDGETVWVSQRLVVELCDIDEERLRTHGRCRYKQSLPPSWQKITTQSEFFLGDNPEKSWRWGRKSGQYYYDIDRIPNRKPTYYRDLLPSKDDLIALIDDNNVRGSRERRREQLRQIEQCVAELVSGDDTMYYRFNSNPTMRANIAEELSQGLA